MLVRVEQPAEQLGGRPPVAAGQRLGDVAANRVELFGGMGPIPAAAVMVAVDVPVGTVLFGFESLPAVATYGARFEDAVLSLSPNG